MSVFPGWEQEGGPPAPVPPDTDLYAHVEGLVGEEEWLEEQGEPRHHERLGRVRADLDHLHELLARRRERRGASG
jgi:hypothetical protein